MTGSAFALGVGAVEAVARRGDGGDERGGEDGLGALTALGPFTIDLYLPAFPMLDRPGFEEIEAKGPGDLPLLVREFCSAA